MICNSCGRNNNNENANFCEYCGASYRDGNIHRTEPAQSYNYQGEQGNESNHVLTAAPVQAININEKEKPVSFANWLGTYAIMLIPCVGGLVFFVMLIVWSFGGNVPESKRNWSRATLVIMVIMIMIVLAFVIMTVMMMKDPMFQELYQQQMEQYNEILKDYSH